MDRHRVAIGTDSVSYPGASPALEWAAAEAHARDSDLLVVHALDYRDAATFASTSIQLGNQVATRLLADAQAVVEARWPDLNIRTLLSHANPTEALIDASNDADLLVIGNNGRHDLAQSELGTVGHRLATRSHCPIVVVPTPALRIEPGDGTRVIVGLAPTRAGRLALRAAFTEARLHGYAVTGLRAAATRTDHPLDQLMDAVAAQAPDVRFDIVRHDAEAPQALLNATTGSALLVLGCHHSDDPWSARLGSVPAALLGRLKIPVMLVGQLN
jgi:nucleotide-binding universal stress UspA family protein